MEAQDRRPNDKARTSDSVGTRAHAEAQPLHNHTAGDAWGTIDDDANTIEQLQAELDHVRAALARAEAQPTPMGALRALALKWEHFDVQNAVFREVGLAYRRCAAEMNSILAETQPAPVQAFPLGARVRKTKGSSWQGRVVGHYSTALTPDGCAVESEREPGSVQIYPAMALEEVQNHDD